MGGNKNGGGKRQGGSSSHAGKHNGQRSGGGRNANPIDGSRVVIKKGKGEMTALPGKELKAAANRMMAQVLKRRQKEEAHRPGANKTINTSTNKDNNNNNNNNNNRSKNNNANDDEDDDDQYEDYDGSDEGDDGVDHQNDSAAAVADTLRQARALAVDARSRQAYHSATQQSLEETRKFKDTQEGITGQGEFRERSLKKFFKNLKDVIDQSDVILEVVDARDPMGCRLTNIEDMIESEFGGRKQVVVVMNKIDLLPSHHIPTSHYHKNENNNNNNNREEELKVPMIEWLRFFRENQEVKITEVCPFTCNSNKSVTSDGEAASGNANHHNNGSSSTDSSSINQEWCVSNLYSILRRLATVDTGARKNINVGVIGYPNVGKSSVINALRGKNVVGVGNMPGFTVGNTTIDLRKDIKIIDCPGVVMPGEDMADIVLRNAAKVDKLNDPLLVVARLLARCDPVALAAYYDIPIPQLTQQHHSSDEDQRHQAVMQAVSAFLKNVAWKRGRGIKQNGSIDEEEAARMVLKDWNDSRIQYYSLPPERMNSNFAFSGVAGRNFQQSTNNQMLSNFSESATIFGKSDLPRFFIQMPKGDAAANFRVAWSQDSMFIAAEGADAPINYNPLDNIDPATGLPYGYEVPGQKKKKKLTSGGGGGGGNNNQDNNNNNMSVDQQANQMARNYLDQLYGTSVTQD